MKNFSHTQPMGYGRNEKNILPVTEKCVLLRRSNSKSGIETAGKSSRLFLYLHITNRQVNRLVVCASSNARKDLLLDPERHRKSFLFNVQNPKEMNEQVSNAVKSAIVTFNYEGTEVSFSKGNGVMVNATEMAKPFGKKAKDFLKLQQTNDLLEELTKGRKILFDDLVQVRVGSPENGGGTWMHEDVALVFAQWLSPKFYIWCNDCIKELLTRGVTTVSDDDDVIAQAMEVLQRRLDEKARRLQMAESTIEVQEAELKKLAPMAEYTREVLQSDSTYTFTQVAKDLGMRSVAMLMDFLHCNRIVYRQSGQWLPTANYAQRGYFETRTAKYVKSDGTIGTSLSTVITEKGRCFLHNYYQQKSNKS